MTENFDQQDVIETPAPVEETVETPVEETQSENPQNDELTQLKKEKEELEAKNKKLYARLKESEKKPQANDNQMLDPKEIIALSKVHEEDIDEVQRWCKLNDKKPSEALKDKYLTVYLRERAEERKTADVTNTRQSVRQTAKVSGDEVLSRVRAGKISEDDDMDKLTDAYLASKRPKAVK